MLRALYSSATGMVSQQTNLDVISNNLANVNTSGFKKSKIEFQDLIYQTTRSAGSDVGGGNQLPTGIQIGHGSRVMATTKIFTTGDVTHTGAQLDVAIDGNGFFEVVMPDGSPAYTRDGAFKLDSTGRLVTGDGLALAGGITIPPGTTEITIAPTGEISAKTASGFQTFNMNLVRFTNPAGLESMGRNLYKDTPASGAAQQGQPGLDGFGVLAQNYLEMSNVKVIEEMVNMIVAQRAYEVNSKAVQTADDMLQISNNLKR